MEENYKIPRPPVKNLRPEAKKLWREIHRDFGQWEAGQTYKRLDVEAEALLTVAAVSLTEYLNNSEVIAREGATYMTPTGQRKKHPACEIVKISRQGFLAAMKQLSLDFSDEQPRRPGRPLSDGGAALI